MKAKAKAIMANARGGFYEPIHAAVQEDWTEVRRIADYVERVETLSGWGPYTASYRVIINGVTYTYFVEE